MLERQLGGWVHRLWWDHRAGFAQPLSNSTVCALSTALLVNVLCGLLFLSYNL